MSYYVLYDLNDNVVAYYDDLSEFSSIFNYFLKELNRKFKKSMSNYIYCDIDSQRYKLYKFKECI